MEISTDLPNPDDDSGAVGAKIRLVLSGDAQCTDGAKMTDWNPEEKPHTVRTR